MAVNLDFKFTNSSDKAISETGWIVWSIQTVDTLAGNDTVSGKGDDTGININGGTINTDAGKDKIIGIGYTRGISNYGTINTGDGNDRITGTGDIGIFIDTEYAGTINTGAGNDKIIGIGGISNKGFINTGIGNDTITAKSGGINNEGIIDTGAGDDTIDSLKGGFFSSGGKIILGSGNDTLKGYEWYTGTGFGACKYYGGTGKDKILFGKGTYNINGASITSGYSTMKVYEFEQIGGASGGLFTFRDGTLTVDSAGVGTFA
jgi:hypothetical protein